MLEPLVLVSNESGIAILSMYNRECNGGSRTVYVDCGHGFVLANRKRLTVRRLGQVSSSLSERPPAVRQHTADVCKNS